MFKIVHPYRSVERNEKVRKCNKLFNLIGTSYIEEYKMKHLCKSKQTGILKYIASSSNYNTWRISICVSYFFVLS